jgi:S-adenosylmethionine:tRNA ribosyltransferase-isomerase
LNMSLLRTSDYDYVLPPEMIAQTPLEQRDHSRLLMVNRSDGSIRHEYFYDLISHLKPGDVLVFNNSRVIRARLFAIRLDNGKRIEILLLRRLGPGTWETLIGSKKKVTAGMQATLEGNPEVKAEVTELAAAGVRIVHFSDESALPHLGQVPLPPYIHTPLADPERYQTVYAEKEGSVAAPTAGLHFTPELLQRIQAMGVHCLFVTLHVGLNTFRPVQTENILKHPIFPEYGVISEEIAAGINLAKAEGRRVICVGTTSVRLLESAAHAARSAADHSASHSAEPAASSINEEKPLQAWDGWVNDFIYPGYRFKIMDALITNFHLPKSTLLMLVSAFAGKELIFKAYQEAIAQKYRFYSFGDAMLIF